MRSLLIISPLRGVCASKSKSVVVPEFGQPTIFRHDSFVTVNNFALILN
jgi:hypothetical protein